MGASSKVKFDGENGERLIIGETIDFVHIYETKAFEEEQIIEFFGDMAGFDTSNEHLYIGVIEQPNLSCIMEYTLNEKGIK
jgi:hypothetical protein